MNRKNKFTHSVTALYCRLSIEDGRENESMSIQNQDGICQGHFHHQIQILGGSGGIHRGLHWRIGCPCHRPVYRAGNVTETVVPMPMLLCRLITA